MLYIGNFMPFESEFNNGCMYWDWFLFVDFQLFLLVPLFVITMKKSPLIGMIVIFLMMSVGFMSIVYNVHTYDLKAGVFSPEDYYLFSHYFNKPYSRLPTYVIGVMFAFLYSEILHYRAVESLADKRKLYPFIHFIHKYSIVSYILVLTAAISIPIDFLCVHPALLDPWEWSVASNAAYFALVRPAYATACMLAFLALCLGHLKMTLSLFKTSGLKFIGNLCFIGSFMGPYMINWNLQNTESAQFVV